MYKTVNMKVCALVALCICFSIIVQAQSSERQNNDTVPRVRAKVVYGEFLGSGLIFSAHYDFRFGRKQNGWGMRTGLGFFGGSGGGILSVPIGINHLAGKGPHYFESGIGYTLAAFTGDTDFLDGSGSLLMPSLGYRYQPLSKGFVARVYLGPLVGLQEGSGWFFWGGFSLGYKLQ